MLCHNFSSKVSELLLTRMNCPFLQNVQVRNHKIIKPRNIIKLWKISKGDQVKVISGKDKGKIGEVLSCDRFRNMVKVKGCNLRKIYLDNKFVYIEKKIHYSNVQLIDDFLKTNTKVCIRYTDDNEAIRISKKSGIVIPWPSKTNKEDEFDDVQEYPLDTPPQEALKKTYDYKTDVKFMNILRQTVNKYNRELS
ncbi:50S ribosomal protein L24, putative [Plasmodium knowlesi strain H]|uniref:Large ribosomal subunit protein uL24c n=3 Tax=Plasmodium knowlesi TaxID=5850 RepID=A0A5K1VKL4_PLAKH|nr:50S ribosomal protein L24, putative [Plasmodium knowlesi strain H]OTN64748.1 putative 50S ribosomal protein L24 [Plasmodium knowlesi]CAA9989282.1 50S ribosomal protein L24, putative [Plasmodium knowlesi strain H]SBO26142.1 50S ribosomal protein L24, putative [Plasmodium knowlesi strain H]SBO26842.1 50S ribosomal protein L24, putative [Plasmodium knowlesi strain H]VVS78756.1 50S ribosomal protein L24, putative [Plasmodium knowlesi strain H]|eukprot:XP_002261628.1 50S ribosomal protein subunit, putative [Plasmodium knowlesi strain H]